MPDKVALPCAGSVLIFGATGITCLLLELSLFFLAFGFRLFPVLPVTPVSCFTDVVIAGVDVVVLGILDLAVCFFGPFLVPFPDPVVVPAPPPLACEGVELLLVGGVEVGIGEGAR